MTGPQHADLGRVRARAVGALTVVLIALVVFSFVWYLIVPHYDRVEDEATRAQIAGAQQAAASSDAAQQG